MGSLFIVVVGIIVFLLWQDDTIVHISVIVVFLSLFFTSFCKFLHYVPSFILML